MKRNALLYAAFFIVGFSLSVCADITNDLNTVLAAQDWGTLSKVLRENLKNKNKDVLRWMHEHQSLIVVNNEFCLYYLNKFESPRVEFTHENYSHLLECMLMFFIRMEQDVACCNNMRIEDQIKELNQLNPGNVKLPIDRNLLGFKDLPRRSTVVQEKFYCRWFPFFQELAKGRGVPVFETILNRLKERYGIPLGNREKINKPIEERGLLAFEYFETPATVLYCSLKECNTLLIAGKTYRLSFCFSQAEASLVNFFVGNADQQAKVAWYRQDNAKKAFYNLSGYTSWLSFWSTAMEEIDPEMHKSYKDKGLFENISISDGYERWLEYDSEQDDGEEGY